MSTYVIRGYHWGYNDETYYPSGSYIKTVFQDEIQAKKEKIALERQHWSQIDLDETPQFFDTDHALIDQVNEFTQTKLGKPLFESESRRGTYIPQELNDKDFQALLELADLEAYKLTKFDEEPYFYALWEYPAQGYAMEYDECSTALVYAPTIEDLFKEAEDNIENYIYENEEYFSGSLEELSETPSILKEFLAQSNMFEWQEGEAKIELVGRINDEILRLNELLKKPIYRIDKLTLAEVQKIEAENSEEYMEW